MGQGYIFLMNDNKLKGFLVDHMGFSVRPIKPLLVAKLLAQQRY